MSMKKIVTFCMFGEMDALTCHVVQCIIQSGFPIRQLSLVIQM
jgi:hypothetical protein